MAKLGENKKSGRLPKSIGKGLNDPIKVIGLDVKATNKNLKEGNLEPYRWVLNRPQSLKYDIGILIEEPTCSGELTLDPYTVNFEQEMGIRIVNPFANPQKS